MGWSIALLEDTITFDEDGAKAFDKVADELGLDCSGDNEDGTWGMYFNPDHMEHMDFVWRPEVLAVLKEAKANGRALFGSLEGDNEGDFWGYEFKDGEMTRLVGTLTWSSAET